MIMSSDQYIFRSKIACKSLLRHNALLCGMMITWTSWGQTITTAEPRWISYHGGDADDQVYSFATDEFGHVYVAGRTTGGLLLGNDTTDQSGLTHQDAF